MAKEKVIFWLLLPILAAGVIIGVDIQKKKKQSADEFLKDIESVAEKAKAKKKTVKDDWDIEGLKKQETPEDYSILMERDIFVRLASIAENKDEREIIPLKQEEPKKPAFVYKGKMMLGPKVIVIIEDQNTGKSFSVKEGDTAGDFTVLSIDDKEIRLKKKDGEEIVISTVKEEKKEAEKETLEAPGKKDIDEKK